MADRSWIVDEMEGMVRRFRAEMAVTERWAYLNHASVSPLPRPARDAIRTFAEDAAMDGTIRWPEWNESYELLRILAAAQTGADVEEIARVRSTSEGISMVAGGYPWQKGDNVVLFEDEFPSNVYPWLNLESRGVEVRRLPVPELLDYTESAADPEGLERCGAQIEQTIRERLLAAMDGKTRIVTLSHVGFRTGYRQNIDRIVELVHARDALLCVDAIQSLGVVPLNLRRTPVDFLVADGHKWLMGPEGIGVMVIRREHLDRIRPTSVGWASVANSRDFDHFDLTWRPDAGRYEHGSPNMLGAAGLYASWKLLAELKVERIHQAILAITDYAVERLRAIGAKVHSLRSGSHRSGIVVFSIPGRDPDVLQKLCERNGVVLVRRGRGLRISPHAYNTREEIDRMIDVLECAGNAS
ncbi:MAG: aminotransferase class V-fold PLP-dependent enzyme [Planctomycetia bacterium]|nr:aminotransferase class V-fold PLP-dependent enzyme [Planctomycetia bacterium]